MGRRPVEERNESALRSHGRLVYAGGSPRVERGAGSEGFRAYLSLQCTDTKLVQSLASLVAVANILECLSCVLTGNI